MKKKHLLIAAMLFISILPVSLFSSCDKDTNCYLDVLTIDEDTRKPISGVVVKISQSGGNLSDEGVTGRDGIYTTRFSAPAIVSIEATYQLSDTTYRTGTASVRLIEGEKVSRNVTITAYVHETPRTDPTPNPNPFPNPNPNPNPNPDPEPTPDESHIQ